MDTHERGRAAWLIEGLRGVGWLTIITLAFSLLSLALAMLIAWVVP